MAPIIPNPRAIRAFPNTGAFERWMKEHHDKDTEIYIRIYKKDSGEPTVTHAEALEVALRWGWIDGLRKAYDESSFLQRFSPRTRKSPWSQINKAHVEGLIAAGRMTPPGLRQVEAAKADGRWDRAYAGIRTATIPSDLRKAIAAEPKALATFETLNRRNLYALVFRTMQMKTPDGRRRKIAGFVAMLKEGETIYPNGGARRTPTPRAPGKKGK
jgi:uncharacterized protein YdeI (YjbR/CyaY-like superfamily)